MQIGTTSHEGSLRVQASRWCWWLVLLAATSPAQSIVPSWNAPPGAPTRSDVAQIASRMRHSAALFLDGTIAMWGDNTYGQCNVPALPPGTRYLRVSTGWRHTL